MKRIIELEIASCSACPYQEYDAHYSMSRNSGYDCKKTGIRILNDDDQSINLSKEIHKDCPLPTILSSTLKKL